MIIYSGGAASSIEFQQAPGEVLCRFTNTTAKTATRILSTWYLAAKNRTALPVKARKFPN
jgi:hypothetical protein